jgi:acetyl esterase/lipase
MPSVRYHIAVLLVRLKRIIQLEVYSSIKYQRWYFDGVVPRLSPGVSRVRYENFDISGIHAEWAISENKKEGQAILYLYGEAYVIGSIGNHRAMISQLVKTGGCHALYIDYCLAPANRSPTAVGDAVMAYDWLLSHGYDVRNVALAGDSADGGTAWRPRWLYGTKRSALPAESLLLSPGPTSGPWEKA